ncbi:MAG: glycosyltransferase [Bradymonadaceae bacterium]
MRILCLTSSYPRHTADIAGRFVLEHCQTLATHGHEIDVLCWNSPEFRVPDDRIHPVRYAPRRLERLFYGAGVPENIARRPWLLALAPGALAAMIAEVLQRSRVPGTRRPDLLIGHWLFPAGIIARICGRILGIPSLVIGHSGGVHLLDNLPTPAARALAGLVTDGPTTVPTEELRIKFGRHTDTSHVRVLPMGFQSSPAAAAQLDDRQDWLCMGRLVPIKGIDLAIEAFSRAKLPPTTRLHIAGDGPERERYESMAGPNIIFHGFVTGPQKEAILKRCGFFLLTSKTLDSGRHEGLPVSLLEASHHALIPLTTDIPGIAPHLAHPARQNFPDRDVDRWAARITSFAAMPETERQGLSEATRRQVAPLTWKNHGPHWHEFVLECVV